MSTTSQNPIIFNNHDEWIKKFTDRPKTTDDCFTPPDVYEAVVKYVGAVVDLAGHQILRPFFPGGDYEHADYPADGIVIDNPPFSSFSKIVRFYAGRDIPFFLFGPGLTITQACDVATAVIVGNPITFSNGANIPCGFASNLFGDTIVRTAPALSRLISACPSQNKVASLPKRRYPDEILSVSDMQIIARAHIPFSVPRTKAILVGKLDNCKSLFGKHLLVSTETGKAKERAKERAKNVETVLLSERERQIVRTLSRQPH